MATDTLTGPVTMGTATRPKVYKNFIDGEWVESSTGETFENRNPADTRDWSASSEVREGRRRRRRGCSQTGVREMAIGSGATPR